jgi:prevent-host-death family protein
MKEVAISVFKAKCLGILEEVRKTRRPIRVTRFGKPVAEVIPPTHQSTSKNWLGCMEGTIKITGDIVGSISPESEWDAGREDTPDK